MDDSIDRARLIDILERIDAALDAPQKLCLIGGAALMLMGNPGRQTKDIDVWRKASQFAEPLLRKAAVEAKIDFDPKEHEPSGVYLQIINPGIVNLPAQVGDRWPDGSENVVLWQGRHLQAFSPSVQVLAAAKIIRATEVDLADIAYLVATTKIGADDIRRALKHFPDATDRETGTENVELLGVFIQRTVGAKIRDDEGEQR